MRRFVGGSRAGLVALGIAVLVGTAGCSAATSSPTPAPTPTPTPTPTATPVPTPTTKPEASPTSRILWTYATAGCVWGGAAVSGGTVYVGSDDGYLYAVDAKTGSPRWQFKTGGLIRSTPAVEGGLVYFSSDDGNVYALRAVDGSKVWSAGIGEGTATRLGPSSTNQIWDYLQSSPVVAAGTLYVGSDDKNLYALDAATGNVRWKFAAAGMIRATPAIVGDTVFLGSWIDGQRWTGRLYALDAATGRQKWAFDGTGDQPTPVVVDGVVYVGGRQSKLYAIDAATGKPAWSADFSGAWVESSATVVNGVAYIGSSDIRRITAYSATDGSVRWQFDAAGYPWSSPTVDNDTVYIGSAGGRAVFGSPAAIGKLYAIDSASGSERWSIELTGSLDSSDVHLSGITARPAVADGVVYAGALDGRLYAVNAR